MKKILLCVDNSALSLIASNAALNIARAFGSEVVGIHAYNAFMHEGAFRIMEPTLPHTYQKEEILQKQRDVHSKLIKTGMEKISLSYLKPLADTFAAANIRFRSVVKEGKNFRTVNEILSEEDGDLVVMGSSGFNSNGSGFIGSVCLRVLRSNDRNFLIIRKPLNLQSPRFVVCLDGSSSAISALRMAKMFTDKYSGEIHLLYVYDSALHKEVFERLKKSLITVDGFTFNSEEQERIHDEFIDKGLARVGNLIIDKAEREVFGKSISEQVIDWGLVGEGRVTPRIKKVLEGHIYKRICEYAVETDATLVFIGRTGRHFTEGIDIGSVTENVVRFSLTNVFITRSEKYKGWEL
jgi:nucleotide-binding universal stress UspA family protein